MVAIKLIRQNSTCVRAFLIRLDVVWLLQYKYYDNAYWAVDIFKNS